MLDGIKILIVPCSILRDLISAKSARYSVSGTVLSTVQYHTVHVHVHVQIQLSCDTHYHTNL